MNLLSNAHKLSYLLCLHFLLVARSRGRVSDVSCFNEVLRRQSGEELLIVENIILLLLIFVKYSMDLVAITLHFSMFTLTQWNTPASKCTFGESTVIFYLSALAQSQFCNYHMWLLIDPLCMRFRFSHSYRYSTLFLVLNCPVCMYYYLEYVTQSNLFVYLTAYYPSIEVSFFYFCFSAFREF